MTRIRKFLETHMDRLLEILFYANLGCAFVNATLFYFVGHWSNAGAAVANILTAWFIMPGRGSDADK